VIDKSGQFIAHPGADLFIDKRETTTVGGYQLLRKLDYRTNKVRLAPGDMHTDFFDLGAFLQDAVNPGPFAPKDPVLPSDFQPILSFHDNYGNNYYCNEDGVHRGH